MPHLLMEETAKRSEALESHLETNVSDAQMGATQQFFGPFYATFHQILVRSFIKGLPEKSQEVIAREACLAGNVVEVQREIVAGVDEVSRPAKAIINVGGSTDVVLFHGNAFSALQVCPTTD